MNLRQVECFLAVAAEGHFRRAAERVWLSPASVSEAIAALEASLGGRLFDRSTRQVRLTPLGASFLEDVREPYEQLKRAHSAARLRSHQSSELVIAHTPELGHLLLPSLLSASSRDAGLAAWRPRLMHTPEQIRSVEDGSVDIGLCWSVPAEPPLRSVPLGEFPIVAILRDTDPLARQARIRLEELRSRSLLMTPRTDNPFIDNQLQTDLLMAGIPASNIEEVLRYDELAVQVASSGRVGLHPGTIALMNHIPGVVFRPVIDPASSVVICALTRTDGSCALTDPLVAALADVVGGIDLDSAAWH